MQNAFYRDFYDKALLPAGISDRKAFFELNPTFLHTHLLIGLQGHKKTDSDVYQWNVLVYQTDTDGFVSQDEPIYSSALYDLFDDAVEAARNIENEVINDHLHAVLQEEKIS